MKQFFFVTLSVIVSYSAVFCQNKIPQLDKSPLDMSYYPDNFPLLRIQEKAKEPLIARVVYSRPQKNGRVIFGNLIEYGKLWRSGANEATEIEFFQPVKIKNYKIKKGRYTLYTIPDSSRWTIVLNKETDTWGSFKYDKQKDILRIDVPVEKQTDSTESFSMFFEKSAMGFSLQIAWDDVKVSLPISL